MMQENIQRFQTAIAINSIMMLVAHFWKLIRQDANHRWLSDFCVQSDTYEGDGEKRRDQFMNLMMKMIDHYHEMTMLLMMMTMIVMMMTIMMVMMMMMMRRRRIMIIFGVAQPEVQQLFCTETRLRQDDAAVVAQNLKLISWERKRLFLPSDI